MSEDKPQCRPATPGPPLRVMSKHHAAAALAIVVSTRPPAADNSFDVRPTVQFLTSMRLNAPELYATAPRLVIATDEAEAAALRTTPLGDGTLVRSFADAVRARAANTSVADVHRFPEVMSCLAPRTFASVTDIVRYSAVWRTLKRAYGAALAFEEARATHVMVADADGFVWKPLSANAIIAHSRTVWYADHRGRSPTLDIQRKPAVDTMARARSFCSVQPWAASLGSSTWRAHGPRMAIGRDWAAWEQVAAAEELLPAPDADLADDPLLVVEGHAFAAMWNRIENHWHAPFLDAVLLALLTPADLYKHCVRGDVLYLELLYRSYLHKYRRALGGGNGGGGGGGGSSGGSSGEQSAAGESGAASEDGHLFHFRNVTAVLEATLPSAARPLGVAYKPPTLPSAADAHWFHAAPSGLSRLWMHLNGTHSVREAVRALYSQPLGESSSHGAPLVAARLDMGAETRCEAVELILRLPGAAVALTLSSHVPASLWQECPGLAASKAAGRPGGLMGGLGPSVQGVVSPPRYASHMGEWLPTY